MFTCRFFALTKALLLCGTVQTRQKLSGKGKNGDWEMHKIEVRGSDGRVAAAIVNDPSAVPPLKEFIVMPVFIGNNGGLREAKHLDAETF